LLCVVIPTYNEAKSIPELLSRLFALNLSDLYVLIIDDSSPDGTALIAKEMSRKFGDRVFVYSRGRKEGLGTAYILGFAKVFDMFSDNLSELYVAQMDADLSHKPEHIPCMLTALEKYDVVVGSRYTPRGTSDAREILWRRVLSRSGNKSIRWISRIPVRDVTSGFKVFRSEALMKINWDLFECQGFGFQVEVAYQCHKLNYRVYEYPIEFVDRINGCSKMSFSIIFEALWKISQMRLKRVFKNFLQ